MVHSNNCRCFSSKPSSKKIFRSNTKDFKKKGEKKSARDWKCVNCGAHSWKKRDKCYKCGAPKPIKDDEEFGAESDAEYEDEIVSADNMLNVEVERLISRNEQDSLQRLGQKKPQVLLTPNTTIAAESSTTALLDTATVREGDWNCPSCGILLFSWRKKCTNCGVIKPNLSAKELPKRLQLKKTKDAKPMKLSQMLKTAVLTLDFTQPLTEVDRLLNSRKMMTKATFSNVLITLNKAGQDDRAIELFEQMADLGNVRKRPDAYHYGIVLNICAKDPNKLEKCLEIYNKMVDSKTRINCVVGNTVMNACLKSKQWNLALKVFHNLKECKVKLDTTIYNSALRAYSRLGQHDKVYEMFTSMVQEGLTRDEYSWSSMMASCADSGDWILATDLLRRMKLVEGYTPNLRIYTSAVQAFAKAGKGQEALQIFNEFRLSDKVVLDRAIYEAALTACAVAAIASPTESARIALELLEEMRKRSIMVGKHGIIQVINTLCTSKLFAEALQLYQHSVETGIFEQRIEAGNKRIDLRNLPDSTIICVILDLLEGIENKRYDNLDYHFIIGVVKNSDGSLTDEKAKSVKKVLLESLQLTHVLKVYWDNENPAVMKIKGGKIQVGDEAKNSQKKIKAANAN